MDRYLNDMSERTFRVVIVVLFFTIFFVTLFLLAGTPRATASTIEAPDRTVSRVEVTYAEPVPTQRFANRHYFETNDGAAYRYGTNGQCERANAVPNRVCHTVFWYAR